ncbi:MAG: Tad domain-containing protein [Chloroflexi bacterium]|nr:Tad domain-containing protein [Chloroflexota bacterium]
MSKEKLTTPPKSRAERGQSIVILAGGILVLLGFVGLVTDLGYVWARDARLTAAVDSAALAGAPELSLGGLPRADEKAIQFLYTNELPADTAVANFSSAESQSILGAWEYTITVTWQLDTFFMSVFGFDSINLTKRATAAYFPLVDIYASSRSETGKLATSNQSVFGPQSCTGYGDPFSPLDSPWEPGLYSYRYRIYIPRDYEAQAGNILRVEIFDADSHNAPNTTVPAPHTQTWINSGVGRPTTISLTCTNNQTETCIRETTELQTNCTPAQQDDPNIFCAEDIDRINPYWFFRVDENRGTPTGCSNPSSYRVDANTQTRYMLYYFQRNPDGTLVRTDLASYTGQALDPARDFDGATSHNTDLHWVSPGARNDFMPFGTEVPADCGSATGGYNLTTGPNRCPDLLEGNRDKVGSGNGFEINLSTDTARIVTDAATGARYIYLDIQTISGASENGFELWAGPPSASAGIPSDANFRNVYISDNPNERQSFGVSVFAMGTLPMNASATGFIDIPLLYVPPAYAGRQVAVSIFDTDSGTQPPITFYFDTIAESDYSITYGNGASDPEGRCFTIGSNCQNEWVGPPGTDSPAYLIDVPTYSDQCTDPTDEAQAAICTPFYGGRLMVNYRAGGGDTYVWRITLPSLPYLVE